MDLSDLRRRAGVEQPTALNHDAAREFNALSHKMYAVVKQLGDQTIERTFVKFVEMAERRIGARNR